MDTFQALSTPSRSRFGVFKLSKPKRLKARHGLPDKIADGAYVYRAVMALDVDVNWGTWLGEQRDAAGARRPVLLKHTGEENRTRAGADALWLEALLSLKLSSPQVAALLDYGVLDGRPFAVYELVDGVSLSQVLDSLRATERRLPAGVAVGVILQACELVGRLHRVSLEEGQGGFVHGSLCPRNLVLTTRGDVKVMGLVGSRLMGRVVGRQHVPEAALKYSAPQLLEGQPVTPLVDIHSLGAVLLEMLGGTADEDAEPRSADLGGLLRQQLRATPTGGAKSIEELTELLQDAVRRTGTVVARQSIGAQVREASEQELIERRKLIRAQLEAPWDDESSEEAARLPEPVSGSEAQASPAEELEDLAEEALDGGEEPELAHYEESTTDDAVTRIYQGPELEAEPSEAAAPPAWMESRPPERAKSAWSRWSLVIALGVVTALSSIAAIFASRSATAERGADSAVVAQVDPANPKGAQRSSSNGPVSNGPVSNGPVSNGPGAKTIPARADTAGAEEKAAAARQEAGEEAGEAAGDEAEAASESEPRGARVARGQASKARRVAARSQRARAARARGAAAVNRGAVEESIEADEPAAPEQSTAPPPAPVAGDKPSAGASDDLEIEDPTAVAFLSIDATPYATVYVDGEKRGVTPIVALKLAPGPHRLVAKTEDGRTKRFSLLLEPGGTERVKLNWNE